MAGRWGLTAVCCLGIALASGPGAIAQNFQYDYVFYERHGQLFPIPRTYQTVDVIRYIGEDYGDFQEAQDLFIDGDDMLYVADTKNNRVLKLTPAGDVVRVYNGGEKGLKQPSGVYVDAYGDVFVADTENSRIVHLSPDGEVVEEFGPPESGILGEYFTYYPSKISLSPTGYIHVIKGKSIMVLDALNNFRGYLGQPEIGFNLNDWLISIVATEEQRDRIRSRRAPPFTNFFVADDGMIYATSLDQQNGQIKKLSATGENIYPDGRYGIRYRGEAGTIMDPDFVDLTVSPQGIISALERNTRTVFQYDQEGNLLAAFGGRGAKKGRFVFPSSICLDSRGRVYVLDAAAIQIMEPTRFIKTVHSAIEMYSEGRYEEALGLWRRVQEIDENYRLAASGIAKALHKQGKWKEALGQYRRAYDRDGYSKSFVEYRHDRFRRYFSFIVVIAAVAGFAVFRGIIYYYRAANSIADDAAMGGPSRNLVKLPLSVIFRPSEVFRSIRQYRDNFTYLPILILLVLTLGVRVAYIFIIHFPLAALDPKDANIFLEMVKLYVPLFTWVVSCYAVTSILDGEAEVKEIMLATSYATVPYVLLAIPVAAFSQVLSGVAAERNLFEFLSSAMLLWVIILLFLGVRHMHDYHLGKAVFVCVLSVLGMALIWAIFVLMVALTGNLKAFIQGLSLEAWMTIRYR